MSIKDMLLALVVVIAWGVSFIVIKLGLHGMPPMLLGGLRFLVAAFPAVFFIPRPNMPWRWLLAYGATVAFGQFMFLFVAMNVGMPAGLASLVLQAQAFFTLGLAVLFLRERLRVQNIAGLLVAAAGLALIGLAGGHAMTLLGFMLTLCAALMWAIGNIITKKVGQIDMVALVVWTSLVSPIPFFVLSYCFEGQQRIGAALAGFGWSDAGTVLYLALVATLLGQGLWSRLLSRYPASQVAPFSLLVPVIGMACAALVLDEHLSLAQVAGAALVMTGLLVNVFGGWALRRYAALAAK